MRPRTLEGLTMRARSLTALLTPAVLLLGPAWLASPAFAARDKVTICHLPPGNQNNPQTITVSENAVPAHLAHGDTAGACASGCQLDSECDDGNMCTSDACLADGCANVVVNCDDGNVCTLDSCEVDQGCRNLPNNGAPCDDGITCTDNDQCAGTTCVGAPIVGCCLDDAGCEDGDLCTNDLWR